jgi:allophanate hydrolase subunit 2
MIMSFPIVAASTARTVQAGSDGFDPLDPLGYRLVAALINEVRPVLVEILRGRFTLTADRDAVLTVLGPARIDVDGSHPGQGNVFAVSDGQTIHIHPTGEAPVYLGTAGLDAPTGEIAAGMVLQTAANPTHLVGRFVQDLTHKVTSAIRYIPSVSSDLALNLPGPWKPTYLSRTGLALQGNGPVHEDALQDAPVRHGAIVATGDRSTLLVLGPQLPPLHTAPVLGHIVAADLHLLARLRDNSIVILRAVSEEASTRASAALDRAVASAVHDPAAVGTW